MPRKQGSILNNDHYSSIVDSRKIRVGTYNMHSAKGLDGRRDISRIAKVLAASELDFIGLNEVSGN